MDNHHKNTSMTAVYAALGANLFIAIAKLIVSFITTSSTMLAESIHSFADTFNQLLLLIGDKRSKKDADELHSFGYGKEEYFWSMLVAVVLFALGSAFAIYEGIHKVMEPSKLQHYGWIYLVLVLGILAEGKSFLYALKQIKHKSKEKIVKLLQHSTDTPLVVIVIEDFAALLGLFIALIFTTLSVFVNPIFDGIGSIIIGSILGYMSYFLSNELRKLIVGENINREMRKNIKNLISEYDVVDHVNNIRAMYIGRNKFLLNISLDVDDDKRAGDIESIVFDIKQEIRKMYSGAEYINIEISDSKNI